MIWNDAQSNGQNRYRPLHFSTDPGGGPRFGGFPPEGVLPPVLNPFTRFLLSVPLADGLELSLFSSFDMSGDGNLSPYNKAFELMGEDEKIIQFVVHPPTATSASSPEWSGFPPCALVMGNVTPEREGNPYEHHKIGGRPHFEKDFGMAQAVETMVDYVHLLQLAFPVGPGDATLNITWPFGTWVFHVFGRKKLDEWSFAYCWS
ncbi:hypothetical protein OJ996_05710 [Luteolibacter sp. GHJ8]|uniref:DUF1963 domain-containing protein n=1 Tax=Luteolibacter rhizosphaerae TaxID=2989719 RepID=A0ABT3FZN6_9BACT|nr:hypothetical protein [Luteolibacter rhizosphaerae]MCW1913057.1 hypothetical protein [Luteolibacter rhizosphaerae]